MSSSSPEPATVDHGQATSAEGLVAWFTEGWHNPAYESFCRHIVPRLAPDARMVQPLVRPHSGHDAFCRNIATLFALVPDIHGRVLDWRGDERTVFIEFHLQGTVGGRLVRLHACDRFSQDGGLIRERHSFFDPAPLLGAVARSPRALAGLPTLRRRARSLYETAFPFGFTTSQVPPNSTTL
jgi:SnoaL-like domain